MTTLDHVASEAVLQAAVEYARNGDPGAVRFLCARFPGLADGDLRDYDPQRMPFAAWARRVARNKAAAEDAEATAMPPDLVDELADALSRLNPAERLALKEALSRSDR